MCYNLIIVACLPPAHSSKSLSNTPLHCRRQGKKYQIKAKRKIKCWNVMTKFIILKYDRLQWWSNDFYPKKEFIPSYKFHCQNRNSHYQHVNICFYLQTIILYFILFSMIRLMNKVDDADPITLTQLIVPNVLLFLSKKKKKCQNSYWIIILSMWKTFTVVELVKRWLLVWGAAVVVLFKNSHLGWILPQDVCGLVMQQSNQ